MYILGVILTLLVLLWSSFVLVFMGLHGGEEFSPVQGKSFIVWLILVAIDIYFWYLFISSLAAHITIN